MRAKLSSSLPGIVAGVALVAGLAIANNESTGPGQPDMSEMMKKLEPAISPGPAHESLDPLVGEWDVEVKMWMSPDSPPSVSKGKAKSAWALKGRFVQETFDGEFMGKPFHGVSYTGYDNVRRKYRSVWMDDMSTTIVTAEGEAEDGGKVIKLACEYSCPMTGEPNRKGTQVIRIVSRDKHIFEMHDPTLGEKSKTMEITYTRR